MLQFDEKKAYRAPVSFSGYTFDPDIAATYGDVASMIFTCTTDEEKLSAYVPEGFSITRPQLQINYSQSRAIDWMAGSAYNLISVSVPVRYEGTRDRSEGVYALVMWENHTVPILTGNLSMGIPKIFADIEDLHCFEDQRWSVASYEGNSFLELKIEDLKPAAEKDSLLGAQDINLFGWRYVPKVGEPGAELSQAIEFPQHIVNEKVWTGKGSLNWHKLTWQQHPAHCHIIEALADLPVHDIHAVLTQGTVVLREGRGRALV